MVKEKDPKPADQQPTVQTVPVVYGISYSGTEATAWSAPTLGDFDVDGNRWEDLSASDRAKVASHYLVGSGSDDFADLKFPVVNPNTGKLNERALRAVIGGRGAQANIPASSRISARRTAYRLLNAEFDAGLEVPDNLGSIIKELASDGIGLSINELSYMEIAQKIQTKLDRMDDDTKLHFLVECYEDYFIYRIGGRNGMPVGPGSDGEQLFKRTYTVNDDDSVEFVGEPVAVTKRVEYVVMQENAESEVEDMAKEKKEQTPCCPEKVQMLIEHELTNYTEADEEWLGALTEEQIDKMFPKEPPKPDTVVQEPPQMNEEQAVKVLQPILSDQNRFMGLLPEKTRAIMEHGLHLYEKERAEKIAFILGNTNEGVYSQEKLEAMSDVMLDDLRRAIKVQSSYSGLGPTPPATPKAEIPGLFPPGVEAE